ncbi:MAG TPA: alpha-hydroxy acid oxidase [Candidatus Limnocylindrales bacterium]
MTTPATTAATATTPGVISIADFERLALERMDASALAFITGGAEDEVTLRENVAAFGRWRFLPRVLVDVASIDARTRVLGREVALPIGVAPVAAHGLADPAGEVATARAAAAAGAIFCLSTVSTRSLEDVAAAVPPDARRWFQLYVQNDVRVTRRLVERAEAAGYEAIVLTVDLPVLGYREREKRQGWQLDATLGNFGRPHDTAEGDAEAAEAAAAVADPALTPSHVDRVGAMRLVGTTWEGIATLRGWTSLPIVIKGILHPDDARLALDHGAAGVVVSNHGGRQLDRSIAALDALPAIVDAVHGRAEVYLDGGIRRGSDALIALALGATAVFAGRPFVFALGVAGEPGVTQAFAILREELERAMALLGVASLRDLTRGHIVAAAR